MYARVGSFFIFLFLTLYITYPLLFHLGDRATGLGDELVITWIQNWVIHAVSTNSFSLFDANLYFPYHNTLAYSDLFLTSSLLSFIPLQLIGQPIGVVNFTLISSLVLLGFSVYLLAFYLTKDFFASLLSGILVIFSPAVLDKVTHLQILTIYWVPLAILFFFLFIHSQKTRYLIISLLFFLLQTYNSFMPGYFILFSYIIIGFYYWFYKRKNIQSLITKKNIFLFIFSFVLITPIIIPYYQVSKEFNYTRDIRDAIHLALHPEDLLYPGQTTRLKEYLLTLPIHKVSQNNEFKSGYLGFVFSILALFALWHGFRSFKKKDIYNNSFLTIALLGLVLSLGPFLHIARQTVHHPFPIPLPYALFYYLLPGFQGFRNSARWEMLFVLCMAVLIALILHKVLKKFSSRIRIGIYLVLIIGSIAEFNFPMNFYPIPQKKDFPQVYHWLTTTPQNTKIIELPIYNWNMYPFTSHELYREYFGTAHLRKTVNGYTGFSPPPWQELINMIDTNFPSNKTVILLKKMDLDYVIIHTDEFDALSKSKIFGVQRIKNGKTVIKEMEKNPSFKLVKKFKDTSVFQLEQ